MLITELEAANILGRWCDAGEKHGRQTPAIHLFGIRYADDLKKKGQDT